MRKLLGLLLIWAAMGFAAPAAFHLISPVNYSTDVDVYPKLTWAEAADSVAVVYTVQIGTHASFLANTYKEYTGIVGNSFYPDVDLHRNTLYYWRVMAVNANGEQTQADEWSSPWFFQTISGSVASIVNASDTFHFSRTFTQENSPYHVRGAIHFENANVHIEPGVSLLFDGQTSGLTIVNGELRAVGNEVDSIFFRFDGDQSRGAWKGIRLVNSGTSFDSAYTYVSGSRLNYCVIQSTKDSSALQSDSGLQIQNSEIFLNSGNGLSSWGYLKLENVNARDNSKNGIVGSGSYTNVWANSNGENGLLLHSSVLSVELLNVQADSNGKDGVSGSSSLHLLTWMDGSASYNARDGFSQSVDQLTLMGINTSHNGRYGKNAFATGTVSLHSDTSTFNQYGLMLEGGDSFDFTHLVENSNKKQNARLVSPGNVRLTDGSFNASTDGKGLEILADGDVYLKDLFVDSNLAPPQLDTTSKTFSGFVSRRTLYSCDYPHDWNVKTASNGVYSYSFPFNVQKMEIISLEGYKGYCFSSQVQTSGIFAVQSLPIDGGELQNSSYTLYSHNWYGECDKEAYRKNLMIILPNEAKDFYFKSIQNYEPTASCHEYNEEHEIYSPMNYKVRAFRVDTFFTDYGLWVKTSGSNRTVDLDHVSASGNTTHNLFVEGDNHLHITKCSFNQNRHALFSSVALSNAKNVFVSETNINHNAGDGIYLENAGDVQFLKSSGLYNGGGGAVFKNAGDVHIKASFLEHNSGHGVYLENNGAIQFLNSSALYNGGSGAVFKNSGRVEVEASFLGHNGEAGLSLQNQDAAYVLNSFFDANDGLGLYVNSVGTFMMTQSFVDSNQSHGLQILDSVQEVHVVQNHFQANQGDGINVHTNHVRFQQNKVYGNSGKGVNIAGTEYSFYLDTLEQNAGGGLYSSASDVKIQFSVFIHNQLHGASVRGAGVYLNSVSLFKGNRVYGNELSLNAPSTDFLTGAGAYFVSFDSVYQNVFDSNVTNGAVAGAYFGTSTFATALSDNVFKRNIASGRYGGVYTDLNLQGIVLHQNQASSYAAGFLGGDSLVGNTITGNIASAVGCFSLSNVDVVQNNIVTHNQGEIGGFDGGVASVFVENEIHHNGGFVLKNSSSADFDITQNWWGTRSDAVGIGTSLYDGNDDPALGFLTYQPMKTNPISSVPGYLTQVMNLGFKDSADASYFLSKVSANATLFVEILARDSNEYALFMATVRIENLSNGQFILPYVTKTAYQSHVYQGQIQLGAATDFSQNILMAAEGDTLVISCLQYPSQSRKVVVGALSASNHAPVITSVDTLEAMEDDSLSYLIAVQDDQGTPNITTLELPFGLIQQGLKIEGSISVPGRYSFVIIADDGELITQKQVTVIVHHVNDKPSFTSPDTVYIQTGSRFAFGLEIQDEDDVPFLAYLSFPSWLQVQGDSLVGTPVRGDLVQALRMRISDSESDTTVVIPMVRLNTPPVLLSDSILIAVEDSNFTYTVQVSDLDQEPQFWFKNLPSWLHEDPQHILVGMALQETQDTVIQLFWTDGIDTLQRDLPVTIHLKNDAPQITSLYPDSLVEEVVWSYQVTYQDEEDRVEDLILSLIDESGVFSLRNDTLMGLVSDATVPLCTLRVTDSQGLFVDQVVAPVLVTVNDTPVIHSVSPDTATQFNDFVYDVVYSDEEDPNDLLTLNLDDSTGWFRIQGNQIVGVPQKAGTYGFTIQVTDRAGLASTQKVVLNIGKIALQNTPNMVYVVPGVNRWTLSTDTSILLGNDTLLSIRNGLARSFVDTVLVSQGIDLTIDSGMQVQLAGSMLVKKQSDLFIRGTLERPVVFSPNSGHSSFQRNALILENTQDSRIEFGQFYSFPANTILVDSGSVAISHSYFDVNLIGVALSQVDSVEISFCTFIPLNDDYSSVGVYLLEGNFVVVENNLFGKSGAKFKAVSNQSSASLTTVNYNLAFSWQNNDNLALINASGVGNIVNNYPIFISETDFHQEYRSPGLDMADPTLQVNEPGVNGCRNNVGYYGNTAQAAATELRFLTPLSSTVWRPGNTGYVYWDGGNKDLMQLEYTTDGQSWYLVTDNFSDSYYLWTIPQINSTTVQMRLSYKAACSGIPTALSPIFTIAEEDFDFPPIAVDDPGPSSALSTRQNQPLDISVSVLKANDSDDGTFTITQVLNPQNGTVLLNGTTITFTPDTDKNDNNSGPFSFDYVITDSGDQKDTATVTISVSEYWNQKPVARDNSESGTEDIVLILEDSYVLFDDTNDDGIITLTSVFNPINGSVVLTGTTITFTPTKNANDSNVVGGFSFEYEITDKGGLKDTALVTLSFAPDPPIAVEDSGFVAKEDSCVVIHLYEIADNDSDDDGNFYNGKFSVTRVFHSQNGTTTLSSANVSFCPDPNENSDNSGPFGFDYEITNLGGVSDTAHVYVDVWDAPEPVSSSSLSSSSMTSSSSGQSSSSDTYSSSVVSSSSVTPVSSSSEVASSSSETSSSSSSESSSSTANSSSATLSSSSEFLSSSSSEISSSSSVEVSSSSEMLSSSSLEPSSSSISFSSSFVVSSSSSEEASSSSEMLSSSSLEPFSSSISFSSSSVVSSSSSVQTSSSSDDLSSSSQSPQRIQDVQWLLTQDRHVEIYDVLGKQVWIGELKPYQNLMVSELTLEKGIYVIKYKGKFGFYTEQVMRAR